MTNRIHNCSSYFNRTLKYFQGVQSWIHEHPTTVKVIKISSAIAGLGLLISTPFAASLAGTVVLIGIALSGVVIALAASIAFFALDYLAPPHHDMKIHAFIAAACEGGKLYYEGDIPILTLDSNDPYKAGKAQGYLCGNAIHQMHKECDFVLHTLLCRPRSHCLPRTLAQIRQTIPTEYLREMQGLVEGYQQWANEHASESPKTLTLDDILLFHLLPDALHFKPDSFENQCIGSTIEPLAVSCTAIVGKTPQNDFQFVRNLDWPSLGKIGAYSLVINRKYTKDRQSTIEVGIPGFIGTLTGMNDQGFCVAQNACTGISETIRGMPTALYTRACLEHCRTVKEAEHFSQHHDPLGPYHLITADQNRAQSFHFYQSPENKHVMRSWEDHHPLITLNSRYSPTSSLGRLFHRERQEAIEQFFQQQNHRPLEEALTLPFVNNWETVQRISMEPRTKTFKVAFDNAFAGNIPFMIIPTNKLFGNH